MCLCCNPFCIIFCQCDLGQVYQYLSLFTNKNGDIYFIIVFQKSIEITGFLIIPFTALAIFFMYDLGQVTQFP